MPTSVDATPESPNGSLDVDFDDDTAEAIAGEDAGDAGVFDSEHLADQVESRMREMGLNKSTLAKNGGPSRTVLAGIRGGKRGRPSEETLEKLDSSLQWEPGSAAETARGGYPTPREGGRAPRTQVESFENLNEQIEARLTQLRMTKSRLAEIGGPSRNTLATLGKRGYRPTRETFDRLDSFLGWEPGGALTAFRGGTPVPKGTLAADSMVGLRAPAAGALELLRAAERRVDRFETQMNDMIGDVRSMLDQARKAVEVVNKDLGRGNDE